MVERRTAGSVAVRVARRHRIHAQFALSVLALLSLSRLGILIWLGPRAGAWSDVAQVMAKGLRMDLAVIAMVVGPAFLAALALGGRTAWARPLGLLLRAYYAIVATTFVMLEAMTPPFILEFDSRPNRLAVEYLAHPAEIGLMLLHGFIFEVLLATLLSCAALFAFWRLIGRGAGAAQGASAAERLALLAIGAPLLLITARSSFGPQATGPSDVAFSRDHLLNDLCFSSFYGVALAFSRLGDEGHAAAIYGALESDQAVLDGARRAMLTVAAGDFTSDSLPTLHRQTATVTRTQPLNLVMVLEESLGARYIESLGGEPIAPFMDSLRHEGWWFEQMYATGTRSARSIEALISGFLPTPARSTIKLDGSQEGFFTLAQLLKRAGYRTQFIYGGQSSFDNMGPFFTANGFDEIIDQDDYRDPVFVGPWGVSDEDVFARAHQSFMAAGEAPFFSLVFSGSNHPPWLYPDGRVAAVDGRPASPRNAARYADGALRGFFEAARDAPYFENTVFVVVADHDARVYGPSLVPIEHFHIPAVIIGPGIEARADRRQVSQIDLAPTLLSLLGLSLEHPMVGYDLTALADDATGRAIMQYGRNQAFMRGDHVVKMPPGKPAQQFTRVDGVLEPVSLDPQLAREALVHALLPSLLYRDRSYRLRD